jgi:pimeloyl-ACP methyl ester carboxylesterase
VLEWRRSRAWRVIRLVWVALGVAFLAYMVLSYSARGVDDAVLESGGGVQVIEDDATISFLPRGGEQRTPLLFLPGGMVDPDAYAPLLRQVAESGHAAILVKLPSLGGRHAMGAGGRREAVHRARATLSVLPGERRWVVAGHSLGGLLAAMVARDVPDRIAGLALLGTTHPRDFSLADARYPVVKVYGTRDGIAPVERMRANAANLPESTRWVAIEGGNHSQFGYYGFQLFDHRARITREAQQARVAAVLLELLDEGSPTEPSSPTGPDR